MPGNLCLYTVRDKLLKRQAMPDPDVAAGGLPFPKIPAVIFANWREALNLASLPPGTRNGYIVAIHGYLEYCRLNHLSVTRESARAYMADAERRGLARRCSLLTDA